MIDSIYHSPMCTFTDATRECHGGIVVITIVVITVLVLVGVRSWRKVC